MQLTDVVDCLIPRGGPALIQSIRDHATVPVIIDGDGNCHVYVDAAGRPRHARSTSWSTPRPSARACATRPSRSSCTRRSPTRSCPASRDGARRARRRAGRRRRRPGAGAGDGRGDRRRLRARVPRAEAERGGGAVARRRDRRTSTASARGHTEAILTRDLAAARRFTDEVDAGTVVVNASTRFTDGDRVRVRRRDRDLHAEAARAGPDGAARAHHLQVRRVGRRSDPRLNHSLWLNDSNRSTTSSTVSASADYLADAGIAGVVFLADRLEKPVLVEGPAGVGKTELAKAHRRGHRRPAHPAPVLRGPRRGQGALRVELQEAAAAHPGRQGARVRLGRRRVRHLLRAVPAHPAAARGDPLRGAGRAAHRRGRPGRDRDRGAAARGALRLPGVDPRARHDRGQPAAPDRAAHVEQHP